LLETLAIAGQIVPLCQTGTEKTAFTLLGANTDPGITWRTATEIEATLELEIELLSRRKITLSSTGYPLPPLVYVVVTPLVTVIVKEDMPVAGIAVENV